MHHGTTTIDCANSPARTPQQTAIASSTGHSKARGTTASAKHPDGQQDGFGEKQMRRRPLRSDRDEEDGAQEPTSPTPPLLHGHTDRGLPAQGRGLAAKQGLYTGGRTSESGRARDSGEDDSCTFATRATPWHRRAKKRAASKHKPAAPQAPETGVTPATASTSGQHHRPNRQKHRPYAAQHAPRAPPRR